MASHFVFRAFPGLATVLLSAACASTPAAAPAPALSGAPAPAALSLPTSVGFRPDPTLSKCPRMEVSNAPATEVNGQVSGYKPFVIAAPKLLIAISPVNGACLSSGFGQRSGKSHNGIDLQSKPAGMVHAAATGSVREAGFRPDFGNFVVIDHGQGVFTRYAHLKNIEPGVSEGASIPFGTPLGMMGQTALHAIPIHLHYELLTGNYETQKKSFGLKSINPFDLPQQ